MSKEYLLKFMIDILFDDNLIVLVLWKNSMCQQPRKLFAQRETSAFLVLLARLTIVI